MERRTTAWFSPNLNIEMPLVAYGHAGHPLLMFPTAAADYLEYERFHLVDAIGPFIDGGKIRAAAVQAGVPCVTTLEAATAAVKAIEVLRDEEMEVQALQDRFAS